MPHTWYDIYIYIHPSTGHQVAVRNLGDGNRNYRVPYQLNRFFAKCLTGKIPPVAAQCIRLSMAPLPNATHTVGAFPPPQVLQGTRI